MTVPNSGTFTRDGSNASDPSPVTGLALVQDFGTVTGDALTFSKRVELVEEENTPRANGCDFEALQAKEERGLQEKQAPEPELFGPGEVPAAIGPLPNKEHLQRWEEITRRWGRSPAKSFRRETGRTSRLASGSRTM